MTKMKKAVIFDMDGVLVDSQPLHFEADRNVLGYYGANVSVSELVPYAGTRNRDRWIKYKEVYGLSGEVGEIIACHSQELRKLVSEGGLRPVKGIPELLRRLKEKGLKTALASSSSYDFIYLVLDSLDLRRYFDEVFSGEDMPNGKPSPDIFIAAASKLGESRESCVIIEDSNNGVTAAVSAGIACVGYINPTSGQQDLSAAKLIIFDFSELITNDAWLEF